MDDQNNPQPRPTNTDGFRPANPITPTPQGQFPAQPAAQMQPTTPAYGTSPGLFPAQTPTNAGKRSGKLKFVLIGSFLTLLLAGGGAAAYMQYVVNSPKKIWERAMSTTSKGLSSLVETQKTPWQGSKTEATFSLSSPVAADGSMKGAWQGSNGSATFDVGAAGLRVDGEARMIGVENSTTPDIYLKIKGVDSIIGLISGYVGQPVDESTDQLVQEIDDQWFSIDHTLIDQLAASGASAGVSITPEDMHKIYATISRVVGETLLATNEKAVFTVLEEVGKEDFEGTETYKYKVGVNKENLKNFLTEMKAALKDTKISELISMDQSQTYDEVFDLDEIMKEIDELDLSKAKADVWVEANGKYVRNVRIYEDNNEASKNYIDIGIPYSGGDNIPLQIKVNLDDDESKGTAMFGVEMHSKGDNMRLWGDVSMKLEGTKVAGKMEIKSARSEDQVDVQKPEGAGNIYDLINIFGAGSASGGFDDSLLLEDEFAEPAPSSDGTLFDDVEL